MNDEGVEEVARRIHAEFDRLDAEVAPYQTQKKSNIFLRILRAFVFIPAILIGILTIIFSFLLALSGIRISTENKRLISLLSNLA